jgi:hypothetical protein
VVCALKQDEFRGDRSLIILHCSIFSVLISTDADWEVIRYLHGKHLMQMVTQSWKVYSGKGASQEAPWEHIEMEVELVAHYLQVCT